jgi:hypothetical protein
MARLQVLLKLRTDVARIPILLALALYQANALVVLGHVLFYLALATAMELLIAVMILKRLKL